MPAGKLERTGSRRETDERRLVQAAQADPERFGELYELHFDAVYAFIARRVHDRNLAEDLTADVFYKALEALPRFDWRGVPFGVWLFRIAANRIADQWKSSSKESGREGPEPATEVEFEKAYFCARLFALVDGLPADQRRVVQMRFAEGRSIREIAGALKKSEGAIKQLQFRALETLRKRIQGKKPGGRHG
jgi:RNA polymerase sigma-70 factor (ECF subfamily)